MNIVKLKPLHADKRGDIVQLIDLKGKKLRTSLLIDSKKGSIRANHYHKKDSHYVYLISGSFKYYEKKPGTTTKLRSKLIKRGDMVKTEPMVIHTMEFLEDSLMIVFTTESRDQKDYEKDTVRIQLI